MAFESFFRQAIRKLSREHTQKSRTRKLRFDDLAERINPATGTVSFHTLTSTVTEGSGTIQLAVRLTTDNNDLNNDVSVVVRDASDAGGSGAGTATDTVDYLNFPPTTIVFETDQEPIAVSGLNIVYEELITINVVNDQIIEIPETIRFDLAPLPGDITTGAFDAISLGSNFQHTMTVNDNDFAVITFATGTMPAVEGGATGTVNATLSFNTSGVGTPSLGYAVNATLNTTGVNDYTADVVTFAAATATGTMLPITVTANDDRAVEEFLESHTAVPQVNVAPITPATAVPTQIAGAANITIQDNDSVAIAITTPGTTALTEGAAAQNIGVTLTVTTSGSGTEQLDVPVTASLPGNADYTVTPHVFPAGVTLSSSTATGTIVVDDVDDRLVESALETFAGEALSVTSIANASATTAQTITVADNDSATFTVAAGPTVVTEGGASQNVLVTMNLTTPGTGTQALAVPVSANIPTGNPDYTAVQANFPVNSTQGAQVSIAITAVDDLAIEAATEVIPGQALSIVANPNSATVTAAGTTTVHVLDNDSASVVITSPGTTTLTEGAADQTVQVTITLNSTGTGTESLDVPVVVTLPGNADYTASNATFAAGTTMDGTTANITLHAVNDQIVEPTETFLGQALTAPGSNTALVNVATAQTVVVQDNDSATISMGAATTTVTEGGAAVNVPVSLVFNTSGSEGDTTPQLQGSVSVNLPGNIDYTSTAATFTGTSTAASIAVTAINDRFVEQITESFGGQTMSITANTTGNVTIGTNGPRTIDVVDNDEAVVSVVAGPTTLTEGGPSQSVEATIDLVTDGSGPIQLEVPVVVTLPGNADYSIMTMATFGAGSPDDATANVIIDDINDQLVEEAIETFTGQALSIFSNGGADVTVSGTAGATTVRVVDNDTATVIINPSGGTFNLTEGSAATGNVPVQLILTTNGSGTAALAVTVMADLPDNADYTSAAHTFPIGAVSGASASIILDDVDDRLVEPVLEIFPNQSLTLTTTATVAPASTGSVTVRVTENDSASVSMDTPINGLEVTEGGAAVNQAVTLTLNLIGTITADGEKTTVPINVNLLPGDDDFTSVTATFPANSLNNASANIAITAVNDRRVEASPELSVGGPQSLVVIPNPNVLPVTPQETNASVSVSGGSEQLIVAVRDNDFARITYSGNVTVTEGVTTPQIVKAKVEYITFGTGPIQLDTVIDANVDSATNDFSSNTAIWSPGEPASEKDIEITSLDDRFVEATTELHQGVLSPATDAIVEVLGSVEVTVNDTTDKATVAIGAGPTTVAEGGTANIPATITLTSTSGVGLLQVEGISITANLPGNGDYTSQAAVFASGTGDGAVQQVVINGTDDQIVEPDPEVFTNQALSVTPVAPTNVTTTSVHEVRIDDNDTAIFTISDATITEGGTLAFTVSLAKAIQHTENIDVRVNFATGGVNGNALLSDFTSTSVDLAFLPGTANQSFTVNVATTADNIVEALETFTASLQLLESLPTHSIDVSDKGTGTITDNDVATFTIEDVTVVEGNAITFNVTTSNPLDIDINVGVSYTDQTATGSSDYDSAADNAPFTFTPLGVGATTLSVTVGTNNDPVVEAIETFKAALSTNTVLGGRSVVLSDTAIGTITDNDNAIFSIDDVTINEGGNTATFTVSTTNPIDIDVAIDVSYAGTGSNPATGGNVDFDSLTDSVTFSALSTANRTVTVAIVNDNIVEATETFLASLGTTTTLGGRTITTTDTGLGTIQDNDTAIFTVNDVTVTEGGTISFAVTLDKEIDTPVGIDVGYAGGNATGGGTDYDSATDLANFAANVAGPQTVNVSVATNNDNIVEAVENFIASLTVNSGTNLGGRAVNVSDTGTGTINDNDVAIFTVDDVTVTEGGTINFSVVLDKEIDLPVSVNVNYGGGNATGGNTDYDSTADTANFAANIAGPQTIQVSVPTNDDPIVEAIETFIASLSTSTALGGRAVNLSDTGTGTINDNDVAIFTIDDATANESAGTMTFTISVSNPIDIPVAIDIGYTGSPTAPFTASGAGVDFDSTGGTTATFLANSVVPRQVTVAITNDNIVEATETFRAALTSPTALGGRTLNLADTAIGTITDNDVATFLIDSPTVNESAGTLTFTVSVDNPIDIPVTITSTYTNQTATGGGTDFTSTNGSATFVANVTAPQSITVPINNDNIVEATETFLASISTSTPLGGRSVVTTDTGVGTIQDNDTAIISINDVTVNEADGTATFAITSDKQIDIPLSVSVNYGGGTATGGLDYDSATDTANLGAFSTGPVNVTVNIFNDTLSEATETFIASLSTSTALGGRSVTLSDTGTGTIIDNDTATFTIDDVTINEGAGTATFTLKVTNPLDIDVAIDVNYAGGTAIAGTDYDNATDSVTFVANSTADRTVTVAITNDNIVEATETFIASLSSPTNLGGRTINIADQATGTIQDNDTATFTIDDVIVEEGNVATFTVNLSNPIDTNVTVDVNYAGTGTNPATGGGVDFDSATDSVTFTAGSTAPQTVTVQTTAESLNETIETFLASLSTATALGGRSVSLTDTGLGTIIDHNEAPVLTVPQTAFTFQVNTPLTIQGVSATDTEIALQAPNAQALQVTIAVGNGDVTLATTAGLTFVTGDGTNDATMTFTGNIASVNAALASLTYRPTADTLVPDAMEITVSDLGTLGAGGVMTDTETITLNTLSNLVQSQPSPLTPAINDIVVYGTAGNDNILVQYGSRGFRITMNGVPSQFFGGVKGRVVVFGADGNDTINVASTISRGTYLDGGNGDDSLRGGKGRDTLTGGQGVDTLNGGAGFDQLYEKADTNFTLMGGTRTTDGSLTTNGLGNDVLVRNYIESAFLVGGDSANTINTTAFNGPVTLMGGAGDDILSSGRHHDVLVGGLGADTLNGGDGRDLLIGGAGLDNLTGGNHDDILVGSTTSFDTDAIALGRIRSEWIRTDISLHLRVNHINGLAPRGGKNGTTRLNSSSVFNDTTNDVFTGGAGNDYFVNFLGEPLADFAGLDRQANITITP